MKKLLLVTLLLLSGATVTAGFFGGLGNLVTDAVQIPVDAVDTTLAGVTLNYYDSTHTLPRFVGSNEYGYAPAANSNNFSY